MAVDFYDNRVYFTMSKPAKKGPSTKALYFTTNYFKTFNFVADKVEFFKVTKCCVYIKRENEQ